MRVLVVGAGGREHALAWRLARDPAVERVLAAPGNAGIAREASCFDVAADDVDGLLALVERERVDLAVVGPEGPLVAGLADRLAAAGYPVFGPSGEAARLEGSKGWAKDLCQRYGIPAAGSLSAATMSEGLRALDEFGPPYVVKVDGLAAGKGVVVTEERNEAVRAVQLALAPGEFGDAGSTVVVEEHLSGREVSAFALADGATALPLGFAQDFKRVDDDDAGANTGGMGAYSPVPFVDEAIAERIRTEILERTVRALAEEGIAYRGVLYAGLMLTAEGPRVLEFNCRFGDPETQVLMPLLRSEPAELLLACARGDLGNAEAELRPGACVTVVLASGGYPGPSETGFAIEGLDAAEGVEGATVFHSGTAHWRGRVVTAGGRVLSVSATGASIAEARDRAYEASARLRFEGMRHRTDIAELAAKEERT
ncbi:MAG TPA: phosphoribosylamine--glycine ligase [Actinomycetota bacterium]|nr:phosphoribosylamine--glycine ligase [Actinomycetota bacterium]